MLDEQFDKQTGFDPEAMPEAPEGEEAGREGEADETTGASPGTAQACDDLGLNSLASNLDRFGIKPPGQA
ncbi:MAG: hypothetical protein IJ111_00810 [Eggerthellaceae bacterium]|nr:hypothetical protein [Eggerthellaceae bacterium]